MMIDSFSDSPGNSTLITSPNADSCALVQPKYDAAIPSDARISTTFPYRLW